jgi:hypothetical protein
MAAPAERQRGDLRSQLAHEILLTARARRKLIEFELAQRRVMLALTVMFSLVALVCDITGQPLVMGAAVGCSLLSGVGAAAKRRSSR